MKKSLLLIRLASICFLAASCRNSHNSNMDHGLDSKVEINHGPISSDSTKVTDSNSVREIKDINTSLKNDTTHRLTQGKAIIHKSPEQDKLDSIKNSKTKNKMKP